MKFIKYNIQIPFIIEKNDNIIDINPAFIALSGFIKEDLMSQPFNKVWHELLHITVQPCSAALKQEAFLFTKTLSVRCINISASKNIITSETTYIISEIPNSRFEDNNLYLMQLSKSDLVGIAVYSVPDMILLKANQKYLSFLEPPFDKEAISLGRKVEEIIPKWKGSAIESFWKEAMCTGKVVNVNEYEHVGYKRGITYWDSIITPILEEKRVKYAVSNTYEVTERVINRNKVKEHIADINLKNKQLEAIFESIQDNISLFDKQGIYLKKSSLLGKLFESTNNDVWTVTANNTFFDLEGKVFSKEELCHSKLMKGQKVKNLKIKTITNGEEKYLDVSGVPVLNENNEFQMGVMFSIDITKTINLTNQIKHQKELLEGILDNMQEAVFIFDKDGKYIIKNKAARQSFSVKLDKVGDSHKQMQYYNLDGSEITLEDMPSYHVMCGKIVVAKIIHLKMDEHEAYIKITGTPVFDETGKLQYGIICSRTITDLIENQKNLEETQRQLLQAEVDRNEILENTIEMKDDFLSLISHELRTPLNVMSAAVQALNYICANELSDKANKYIGMIRQNTHRQLRLVNNLLDITRANANRINVHKKNIDIVFLSKAILESVYPYASQKGINLMFESLLDYKIIGIDEEKYERILLNLLSNAIKFTPEGKSIKVKLSAVKSHICIEVKDSGIGIPIDKIETIFEKFGQVDSLLSSQSEGAGIGLSLVKRFVEVLGGCISVKSTLGKGSIFTILLPSERILDEKCENISGDFMNNRLVEISTVEFSDIYL